VPQLEVKNENQAAVCITPQGDAISIVGDRTFTTTHKADSYRQQVHKCAGESPPPVWFRFYDGPNMFAKANYDEISFTMPVIKNALPPIHNSQSLWDQMTILQPIPVRRCRADILRVSRREDAVGQRRIQLRTRRRQYGFRSERCASSDSVELAMAVGFQQHRLRRLDGLSDDGARQWGRRTAGGVRDPHVGQFG
jgi:hypothetical protein